MKRKAVFAVLVFGAMLAGSGWSLEWTLSAGVDSYVLYKGYMAVFVPTLGAGLTVPLSDGVSIEGSAYLRFGFRYFAEDRPRAFFPELLLTDLGLRYTTPSRSEWRAGLGVDFGLAEPVTRSSLSPRVSWLGRAGERVSAGVGMGCDLLPGNANANALLLSCELNGDFSGLVPWRMRVSYGGELGIRLNDYSYRLVNPAPDDSEDLFWFSDETHPYLSYYGHELSLGFPIADNCLIRYRVGNRFVFYRRFPDATPTLVFSDTESLKTLHFALDTTIAY